MTVFLDTTALVIRHIDHPHREIVIDVMRSDHDWCASAIALVEAEMLIERLELDRDSGQRMRQAVIADWERFHVVPVDDACLARASEIGRQQPLRTVDAIHLAAAERLPRPVRFTTFDPNQIGPALSLGFDVVSAVDRSV